MSTRDPEPGSHDERAALAAAAVRALPAAPLALTKATSNLFRDRRAATRARVDLRSFREVLGGDENEVDVEGMASYEELVAWCLLRGIMPAVVPQLKTIMAGGALAGVGIEATSFRHGLVHHTMREIEVLLPHGEIVVCTPANEHRDLFYGFPNSYGSLGYALRARLAARPVKPFVHVRHERFEDPGAFFAAMADACTGGDADFIDGVVFGPRHLVLTRARFADSAPWSSDYTFERIYYRSLCERSEDYLTTSDYLWRWDTDWFWCSRNFGAERPLVRRILGRRRLNSRTYGRLMRLNARSHVTETVARWRGLYRESVIQDVDIPAPGAEAFLAFLEREIGVHPVWVCPFRGDRPGEAFPLYPLRAAPLYFNFGFWDVLTSRSALEPAHFNRLVEREVLRQGGIKSLYSDSFFSREEFDRAYGGDEYAALKARYDPQGRAPHLYDKCVRRA